jgi:capsular polysaccharide transport system ATP-binding protein
MIILNSVYKSYGDGPWILRNITETFSPGRNAAIIGAREQGKTTFLNLLCGKTSPTVGHIDRSMTVSFPLGSNIRVPPKVTVRQLLSFSAGVYAVDFKLLSNFVLDVLQLDPAVKIQSLQKGVLRQLSMAIGYAIPFDYYLFDENWISGNTKQDKLFTQLFLKRACNSSMILATKSKRKLEAFVELTQPDLYFLHRGHLSSCGNLDAAKALLSDTSAD